MQNVYGIAQRLRRRSHAGLLSCAALFGGLLLLPQDVLAQREKSTAKSSGSSKSSARSGGGSSGSSSSARSGSVSRSSKGSSRSSSVSRSSGTRSRSGTVSRSSKGSSRSSSVSRSTTRSKTISRPAPSRPSAISRPSAPRAKSTTRPSGGGPEIQLPERRGDGPPRHLIDLVDPEGPRSDKIGRREGDPEYTHRPRHHHHYPYYYPYYYPHRYYGWGFYRSYWGYRYGYPYFLYGPFGYLYAPYSYGYYGPYDAPYIGGGGGGGDVYGDHLGALDLNVKPKEAVVYVNGDPIGEVDRYDGYPSYLWLEPGTYSISFFLEGYQTLTLEHTVLADVVIAIKERLQPGVATPPSAGILGEDPAAPGAEDAPPAPMAAVGRLMLRVSPIDAAVYLDGHFLGTAGELAQLSAGLVVEPGEHVLELVRPGYHTEEIPLVVPPGEQVAVDRALRER